MQAMQVPRDRPFKNGDPLYLQNIIKIGTGTQISRILQPSGLHVGQHSSDATPMAEPESPPLEPVAPEVLVAPAEAAPEEPAEGPQTRQQEITINLLAGLTTSFAAIVSREPSRPLTQPISDCVPAFAPADPVTA